MRPNAQWRTMRFGVSVANIEEEGVFLTHCRILNQNSWASRKLRSRQELKNFPILSYQERRNKEGKPKIYITKEEEWRKLQWHTLDTPVVDYHFLSSKKRSEKSVYVQHWPNPWAREESEAHTFRN